MVRKVGLLTKLAVFAVAIVLGSGCSTRPSLDEEYSRIQKDSTETRKLIEKLKVHYDRGEKLYADGQLDAAEVEYEVMLELKSEQEHALYRLGTIAFKRGEFERSASFFERTIASNHRHARAHYNLASIRLMQAENHFKYYTALADRSANIDNVSALLGHIDEFADGDNAQDDTALDKIAGKIKK